MPVAARPQGKAQGIGDGARVAQVADHPVVGWRPHPDQRGRCQHVLVFNFFGCFKDINNFMTVIFTVETFQKCV